MSDWAVFRLGEVIRLSIDAVPVSAGTSYDIFGVLNRGRGLLLREPVLGSEISYKTLNRLHPNQIVYSRLKAFEGAITVAPHGLGEVFASQEFPTFNCTEHVLPEYFALVTTTKRLWIQLQGLSTGMGGRRERVKPADFLTIELAVPSLPEQRRIVDVMAAVDSQVEALSRDAEASFRVAVAVAEDALAEYERVSLDPHLDRVEGGRSPMTTGERPQDGERGVLKVSAVTPFQFIAEESKALSEETAMPKAAEVLPGDVLITRANTPERVGMVCRVPHSVREGLYLSDKTLRMVPKATLNPDYLVIAMSLRSSRRHLTSSATGTSASMFNISQAKIRSTPVPMPDVDVQKAVARVTMALLENTSGLREELAALRVFRSTLLTSLLNQEIEIPESYDALLDRTA